MFIEVERNIIQKSSEEELCKNFKNIKNLASWDMRKKKGKDKPKPHNPEECHRKASEHLRMAADHNDETWKQLTLNEAIKHQLGIKKKDEHKPSARAVDDKS